MAEVVLLTVIKKIGAALANGAAIQASVQFSKYATQLIELHRSMGRVVMELRVMHDVLSQMDIRNRNNPVYEGWLDEVRKVAHVMEDMVDEYLHQVGGEHHMGCCFYLKKVLRRPRSLLSLNQIASDVKETEKDLAHLSETKNRWVSMINNGDTSSSNYIVKRSHDLASISRSLDEEDLVGVDKNRQILEQWLGGKDGECSVITLYGMGGLGKTALAANVYRKERDKFQCHACVSVSQTYSREDVLRSIIKELFDKVDVPSNIAVVDITYLEDTLKRFLEQKKYLIILDDVWTPEAFDDLSRALLCNDKGSSLLITTREGDVASLASRGHILTLEALPEDKAWNLFCKKSFSRETNHECPEDLKPLSKEIVSKCKGLPLAIVSVGSLLNVREKTVEEWRRINDQLSWEIINNSRLGHIRNVLHLSFIYLPTYLKSCFLYCSLFPEDYLFRRKQLVRLWMAEGFILEKGVSTLEEVGEGYLKELVSRNMLQLVSRNPCGRMRRFRMHDIIRELAVDLCKKDHFGVDYMVDKCGGYLQMDERRLIVHKLNKDIQQSFSSVRGLRTFITLDKNMPSLTLLPLLSEKSRYMTVLELSGLPIEKIPDAIGDLFNLRHLGLRNTKVKLLPKSIEKLSNLMTLDLLNSDIQEVPAGIVKLKNLRHLFAEKYNDHSGRAFLSSRGVCIPKGLHNLTNLQTLEALEAQHESVKQLGELRQLRSLRISNVKGGYCKYLNESLVQMPFLFYLEVGASDKNEVLRLNALPPNLQKLGLNGTLEEGALLRESPLFQNVEQNLYLLYLHWSQLVEDPLPSLCRLTNLTVLHFTSAYNGEKLVFCTGWFPKLKNLFLGDLPNLKVLDIHRGAIVRLETLYLVNLSMTEVPFGIEFLMPLQALVFLEITRDFLALLHQYSGLAGMQWQHSLRD
ncbi:hypothetical protein ACQ4PT_046316 [Festuca glaucescens]